VSAALLIVSLYLVSKPQTGSSRAEV
jgi:hypothetical protein